jgi:hypothetical protein
MSNTSEDLALTRKAILFALESSALMIMKQMVSEAQITEIDETVKINYDHWVSSTLLDLSKTRIILRVHFRTSDSRYLTSNFFGGKKGHRP